MRVILFCLLLVAGTATVSAQDARNPASLKGLKGVALVVQSFGGIPRDAVTAEAMRALKEAGLRVIPEGELESNKDVGKLDLTLTLACSASSCGYTVRLALLQRVRLSRDSTITTMAPTWYDGYQNAIGKADLTALSDLITVDAGTLVKAFIHDYLVLNPK